MKEMSYLAAFLPIFISSLFGAAPDPTLLPTNVVARQVRELQAMLADANDREREMYFNQMTAKLTDFVAAQLEAEPGLDRWQLRDQLIRARGSVPPERSHYHDAQPPYVFRLSPSSGPGDAGPIVWAVVYRDTLYHGMGGSRILVESYVVENGKARLAGRGGSEMSGYDLNADEIPNAANSVSVLIHGILEWSNGHQFPGKAILYDVNLAGVQTAWQTPMLPGLTAHPDATGFTVIYHDEERHQAAGLRDASVTDTYSAGPQGVVRIGTLQN